MKEINTWQAFPICQALFYLSYGYWFRKCPCHPRKQGFTCHSLQMILKMGTEHRTCCFNAQVLFWALVSSLESLKTNTHTKPLKTNTPKVLNLQFIHRLIPSPVFNLTVSHNLFTKYCLLLALFSDVWYAAWGQVTQVLNDDNGREDCLPSCFRMGSYK